MNLIYLKKYYIFYLLIMNPNETINLNDKNIKKLKMKFIFEIKDSFAQMNKNTFCTFKSINNIYFLVYSNQKDSIICWNLQYNIKICEIKNDSFILTYIHYLDKKNKRDLLLTTDLKNDLKIWDMRNIECIFHIKNTNFDHYLFSAFFLKDNNNNYIVCCYNNDNNKGMINILNFEGKKIKQINDCKEIIYYCDYYYDKKKLKNYIISTHFKYMKSYDYDNNKLYFEYKEKDNKNYNGMLSILVNYNYNFDIYIRYKKYIFTILFFIFWSI